MREFLFLALVAATGVVATIPTKCPATDPWDGPVMLAHESDCGKYYSCLMGRKFEKSCEDNLCFNSRRQVCESWDRCGCHYPLDPECSSVNDNHVWANSANDTTYYQCVKGKKTIISCKKGEIFDRVKLICRKKSPGVRYCPPAGSKDTVRYWHECYCNLFYECADGELVVKQCPNGYLFDHRLLKCVPSDEASCEPGEGWPNDCPPNGIVDIPHESDCYRYYRCVNGHKTSRRCVPGQAFDIYKRMCVWWSTAMCGDRVTTEPPPASCLNWPKPKKRDPKDCNRYFECVKGKVVPGKCLENHYFNEIVQACDLPKNTDCREDRTPDDECSNIHCRTKRFPSDEGCEYYWECQNGKKVLKKCPDGLMYNEKTDMCDYPKNVECKEPKCKPGELRHHHCQCNMYLLCNKDKEWVLKTCKGDEEFDCDTKRCTSNARCCTSNDPYGYKNATSSLYRY